jgi:hypothetical protein
VIKAAAVSSSPRVLNGHSASFLEGKGKIMQKTTSDKYEEAQLLLKIYDMYSSESMIIALSWFCKDFEAVDLKDFETHYPPGSAERNSFWKIGNFFELMGTFLEREYLPNQLVVEFCPDDVKSFWKKVKLIVIQMRKEYQDPTLYINLENLDREIRKWQRSRKKD